MCAFTTPSVLACATHQQGRTCWGYDKGWQSWLYRSQNSGVQDPKGMEEGEQQSTNPGLEANYGCTHEDRGISNTGENHSDPMSMICF